MLRRKSASGERGDSCGAGSAGILSGFSLTWCPAGASGLADALRPLARAADQTVGNVAVRHVKQSIRASVHTCLVRLKTFVLASLLLAWQSAGTQDLSDLERARGVLEASGGQCVFLEMWLAVTPAQQRRGLMYVQDVPDGWGMLFVYDREKEISMWMKNTYVSLDMLFIRADGAIASIATDTQPKSLKSISSGEPVNRVLELKAGTVKRWGIKPGDRLLSP